MGNRVELVEIRAVMVDSLRTALVPSTVHLIQPIMDHEQFCSALANCVVCLYSFS